MPERPHAASDVPDASPQPCPLCRRSIVAGDSAGGHDGRVLHLDCYIAVLRASGVLLTFLKGHVDEPFCTTCLVSAIAVTFDETALAHAWLRTRPGIRLELAPCAGCGSRRVTLAYEVTTAAPSVS